MGLFKPQIPILVLILALYGSTLAKVDTLDCAADIKDEDWMMMKEIQKEFLIALTNGTGTTDASPEEFIQKIMDEIENDPTKLVDAVVNALKDNQLLSDAASEVVSTNVKTYVQSEHFQGGFKTFKSGVSNSLNTVIFNSLSNLFMEIYVSESPEKAFEMLWKESVKQWGVFFNYMRNSDVKNHMLKELASALNTAYRYIFLDDTKLMIANGFLLSQNLPMIHQGNIVGSVLELVDKCLELFTTTKVDMEPLKEIVDDVLRVFAKEVITAKKYKELDDNQQDQLLTQFLTNDVFPPCMDVWSAYYHVLGQTDSDNRNCAENLLCHINAHAKELSKIRQLISEYLSYQLVNVLNYQGKLSIESMERAIANGLKPNFDCSKEYIYANCKVFEWQKKSMMSLDFDHEEL